MNIDEFQLEITDNELAKTLNFIYRGNENIIIKQSMYSVSRSKNVFKTIIVPRDELEKFINMLRSTND